MDVDVLCASGRVGVGVGVDVRASEGKCAAHSREVDGDDDVQQEEGSEQILDGGPHSGLGGVHEEDLEGHHGGHVQKWKHH